MMYLIYSFLVTLGVLLTAPYYIWKRRDELAGRRWRERFGLLPESFQQAEREAIWIHAVSVGETLAVVSLARELQQVFSGRKIFLSSVTPAGRYRTLNTDVELLPNNKVVAAGGNMLAGSAASLNHVVEVLLRFTGAPLVDALAAATAIPARLLGADGMCSCIAEGQPANLFLFRPESPNLGIAGVFLGAEQVSCSEGQR